MCGQWLWNACGEGVVFVDKQGGVCICGQKELILNNSFNTQINTPAWEDVGIPQFPQD